MIAGRYAFSRENRHRSSSVLIMLGICLSVLALFLIIAFMEASQSQRLGAIKDVESFHLRLIPRGMSYEELLETVETIETIGGVEQAFLFADVPAVVKDLSTGHSAAVRIRGLSPSLFHAGPFFERLSMVLGSTPTEEMVAPSYHLMRTLSMSLGDSLELTILKQGRVVRMIPVILERTASGIYQTGLSEFNQQTILTTIDGVRPLTSDETLGIGVFLSESYENDQASVVQAIEYLNLPITIETWQEANGSLYAAMKLETYMMYLVIGLMIMILVTNLRNSTARLLRIKQRELAVLRAMGCTRSMLMRIFILQALYIAAIGVVLGGLLALLSVDRLPALIEFADDVRRFFNGYGAFSGTRLSLSINPCEVAAVSAVILLMAGFFAWLGSRKLLSKNIMEILTHDE